MITIIDIIISFRFQRKLNQSKLVKKERVIISRCFHVKAVLRNIKQRKVFQGM